MKSGTIGDVEHLHCMPDRDCDQPVLLVKTSLPVGDVNSFYIDLTDLTGKTIPVGSMIPGHQNTPDKMSIGDEIIFDKQDGFHKVVIWKGHRIRQRGYSFDMYHQNPS